MKVEHTLVNATQRGFVLELVIDGGIKSIPLVDLLPPESIGKKGTFKISVEFIENVS